MGKSRAAQHFDETSYGYGENLSESTEDPTDFKFGCLADDSPVKPATPKNEPWPEAPERPPLIPEGEYLGVIVGHLIQRHFAFPDSEKLHLRIRIRLDTQSEREVELVRSMNYSRRPSLAMDFYKEWVKANGGKAPTRADRMSPIVFTDKLVRVRVRTVNKDHDGDPRLGDLRYSVVGKILEVL
jgi:hypothetical protein